MVNKKLILIFGMLFVIFLIGSVNASEVCCEKTKIGELCARVDSSECAPGSRNTPNLCSDPNDPTQGPSWCQLGVCYDPNEGICTRGVPSPSCLADGGEWSAIWNASLRDPGCCSLGRNTKFVSPKLCERLATSQGFPFDFNKGISQEACRGYTLDEGACLYEGNTCGFTTETNCIGPGGSGGIDFRKSILCSNINPTTYVKHSKKICDKGNAYWADSKSNKEDLFKDCDDRTESCDLDVNGNAYCKSSNCIYNGSVKKNSESWCVYEAYVGEGKDVVGSKHLLMYCDDGKVEQTFCGGDYREQICAEKTDQWGTTAQCRVNKWKNCLAADNKETCDLADDCKWTNVNLIKNAEKDTFNFSVCTPKYPKGFEFDSVDSEANGKDVCNLGNVECVMAEEKQALGHWDCKENCECAEPEFVEKMNEFCTSLGDCGAKVNYIGNGTNSFAVSGDSYLKWESDCTNWDVCNYQCVRVDPPYFPGPTGCLQGYNECKKYTDSFSNQEYYLNCNGTGMPELGTAFSRQNQCLFHGICQTGVYTLNKRKISWKDYLPYLIKPNTASNIPKWLGLTNLGNIVNDLVKAPLESITTMVHNGVHEHGHLLLVGTARRAKTVKFECLPWKPPYGGADCEVCDDDPLKPCSPYRCSSLGTACKFIPIKNYDEMNPEGVCIPYNRSDIFYPDLSLNKIDSAYSFTTISSTPTLNGEVKTINGDCVEELSEVVISLKTNEEAECRWDDGEIGRIDDWTSGMQGMEPFEEDYAFATIHNVTLSVPMGSDFTMYIKCVDMAGNWNTADHTINLCISPQPRTTPPIIKRYDPEYGSYLPYGKTSVDMTLYTDEPAECRYSNGPGVTFDAMAQNMICNTPEEGEYTAEWFCMTNLSGLSQPENRIYIRCNDSRGNVHVDDREYMLRQTENPLVIAPNFSPQSGTVREKGVTKETPEFLKITTSGGADGGKSVCKYSFVEEGFSDFMNDGQLVVQHEYRFNFMPDGTHTIKVHCEDSVMNIAETTILFTMNVDRQAPVIITQTLQGTDMILTTDEDAECVYNTTSCNYLYESASSNDISYGRTTTHEINDFNKRLDYYVICKDEFNNENCTTIEATEQRELNPPEVVRIFYDEDVSRKLKLITNEPAQCSFKKTTCSFEVGDGEMMEIRDNKEYSTEHYAPWNLNDEYHIKCVDSWGNPNVGCLIVVEPFRIVELEG